MANRPIYHAIIKPPFYEAINIDFQFYSGFPYHKNKNV